MADNPHTTEQDREEEAFALEMLAWHLALKVGDQEALQAIADRSAERLGRLPNPIYMGIWET